MTHIDPFAPGDSPQHPANWAGEEVSERVQDNAADLYQWRRDHFAMSGEADADLSAEELERRHERYDQYFDEFATDAEREEAAEFVALPALLRRGALAALTQDDDLDEWEELFEQHATDEERDPMWVEGFLPSLDELRARVNVTDLSAAAQAPVAAPADVSVAGTPVPELLLAVPKGNALKEEWVEYALAVEKARGGELTDMEAESMTVADLKAKYKPKAD